MRQIVAARRRSRRLTKRFAKFIVVILIVVIGICAGAKLIPAAVTKAVDAGAAAEQTAPAGQAQGNVTALDDGRTKVIVDAGHGGDDFGMFGVLTRRMEKEVNLEIAKKLQKELEAKGINVIMTRTDDGMIAPTTAEDMKKREDIISESNADMFISIHQNFYDKGQSVKGPQVFYREPNARGKKLAQCIQQEMNTQLDVEEPREIGEGDYQLLRPGNQPSVIVECGFFSNPEEEQMLQQDSYQNKIVAAIISGIDDFEENNAA